MDKLKIKLCVIGLLTLPMIISGCGNKDLVSTNVTKPSTDKSASNHTTAEDNSSKDIELKENTDQNIKTTTFTYSDIPEEIKTLMTGKSMPKDSQIGFNELAYLNISYIDTNGEEQVGEMVVNKNVAQEVLDIFKEIYDAKFPIDRMTLVDNFNASDYSSMVANNTSAFNYRTIAGTNKVSNHGKGLAIDINPFVNPHVKKNGEVNPPEASKYADRSLNEPGMISNQDIVYKAFTKRGWKWGGEWNNPDYQHFEKEI